MNVLGWNTSIGPGGKAHFYDPDGPACGRRKGIWPGVTLRELFTRPTRPTIDGDHVCRFCAKVTPRACNCWSCALKREGGLRP